jgi:hypothetical protein
MVQNYRALIVFSPQEGRGHARDKTVGPEAHGARALASLRSKLTYRTISSRKDSFS